MDRKEREELEQMKYLQGKYRYKVPIDMAFEVTSYGDTPQAALTRAVNYIEDLLSSDKVLNFKLDQTSVMGVMVENEGENNE